MKEIQTITPAEATERMRALGIKISPEVIRAGLEQGVFPFGFAIRTGDGTARYIIFEKLFNEWVEARAEG